MFTLLFFKLKIMVKKAEKELEISLELSKIVKLLYKHKGIISILILLFIFYLSLSVRLITVNQPYLLAADPHYWYRMTKFIVEGEMPEYDTLRLWPNPAKFNPGLFPYLAAYSYLLAKFFVNIEFYRFLFWFPAIVASLSVFPAFWIGRELHSEIAGLFASFFIASLQQFCREQWLVFSIRIARTSFSLC